MTEQPDALQFERLVNKIENMLLTDKDFRRDVAAEQAAEFSLEEYKEWCDGEFRVDRLWASCETCFKLTPEYCVKCGIPVCQDCQDIHVCERE